jgi:hypothetical protein
MKTKGLNRCLIRSPLMSIKDRKPLHYRTYQLMAPLESIPIYSLREGIRFELFTLRGQKIAAHRIQAFTQRNPETQPSIHCPIG